MRPPRLGDMLRLVARFFVFTAFAALVISNFRVQQGYVDSSRARADTASAAFVEIPQVSSAHILDTITRIGASLPPGAPVVSDAGNEVLGKLESGFTAGHDIIIRPDDIFAGLFACYVDKKRFLDIAALNIEACKLMQARQVLYKNTNFQWPNLGPVQFVTDRRLNQVAAGSDAQLLGSGPAQTVLNRWHVPARIQLSATPLTQRPDHLILVASQLGSMYYRRTPASTLFPVEPDPFSGSSISGINRFTLLQVLNPTPARFEMQFTSTLRADGKELLPSRAVVFGNSVTPLGFVGRGSARVLSPPLTPRYIDGGWYLMLDLGEPGHQFPVVRKGLMRLYGSDIEIDPRYLVGFSKDISLIDSAGLEIDAPSSVSRFPGDLENEDLAYSGIYEDGWVAEAASLSLMRHRGDFFRFHGLVPRIHSSQFRTTLSVTIAHRVVMKTVLRPGYFDFLIPAVDAPTRVEDVRLDFHGVQRLPTDGRVVSAFIDSVGFVPSTP